MKQLCYGMDGFLNNDFRDKYCLNRIKFEYSTEAKRKIIKNCSGDKLNKENIEWYTTINVQCRMLEIQIEMFGIPSCCDLCCSVITDCGLQFHPAFHCTTNNLIAQKGPSKPLPIVQIST